MFWFLGVFPFLMTHFASFTHFFRVGFDALLRLVRERRGRSPHQFESLIASIILISISRFHLEKNYREFDTVDQKNKVSITVSITGCS